MPKVSHRYRWTLVKLQLSSKGDFWAAKWNGKNRISK